MASGDTLCVFNALQNKSSASNAATIDQDGTDWVLDFADDATEEAIFEGFMPASYAGTTGITATVVWTDTNTTASRQCRWQLAFERRLGGTDVIGTDSFAAVQAVSADSNTTTKVIEYDDITFTDGGEIDSVTAGESFRVKLERDHDHADDDLGVDAHFLMLILKET